MNNSSPLSTDISSIYAFSASLICGERHRPWVWAIWMSISIISFARLSIGRARENEFGERGGMTYESRHAARALCAYQLSHYANFTSLRIRWTRPSPRMLEAAPPLSEDCVPHMHRAHEECCVGFVASTWIVSDGETVRATAPRVWSRYASNDQRGSTQRSRELGRS